VEDRRGSRIFLSNSRIASQHKQGVAAKDFSDNIASDKCSFWVDG